MSTEYNIYDTDDTVDAPDEGVILWRSYPSKKQEAICSIPKLIEDNSIQTKLEYLRVITQIALSNVSNKSILKILEIDDGLSYWWLTLIAEKCNFSKSPSIISAIRFIAFTKWAESIEISRITIHSNDSRLVMGLKVWSSERNIDILWNRLSEKGSGKKENSKLLWRRLPIVAQSLLWLIKRIVKRRSLFGAGRQKWRLSDAKVTLVSYLYNLNPIALSDGVWKTPYWGNLPDTLKSENKKFNVLHIYVEDSVLPNADVASKAIDRLNKFQYFGETHATLESFNSISVILKTLRQFFVVVALGLKIKKHVRFDSPLLGAIWEILRGDIDESFFGIHCISSLLEKNLISTVFKDAGEQDVGIYLMENQPWEISLAHTWRQQKNHKLIGFAHTVIRHWDLRYFNDADIHNNEKKYLYAAPNVVAVGGMAAKNMLAESGYPEERIVLVEALRYNQLLPYIGRSRSTNKSSTSAIRILVLGDFDTASTVYQIQILSEVIFKLRSEFTFFVKPHPQTPIDLKEFPVENCKVVSGNILDHLLECDAVYTGAFTTAAVDAHVLGIPVISVLNPSNLNLSPLVGQANVNFVSDADELSRALHNILGAHTEETNYQQFLMLDQNLKSWLSLLMK